MSDQIKNAIQEELGRQMIKWISIQMAHIGNKGTQGMLFREVDRCLGWRTMRITRITIRVNNPLTINSIHQSAPSGKYLVMWTVKVPINNINPMVNDKRTGKDKEYKLESILTRNKLKPFLPFIILHIIWHKRN